MDNEFYLLFTIIYYYLLLSLKLMLTWLFGDKDLITGDKYETKFNDDYYDLISGYFNHSPGSSG